MNGYIMISRSIIDSEIWRKPPLYLKVWIWLLSNAQFKPYKNLERGQLLTNVDEIRKACAHYSGYRKEMPTKKQIYSILQWLRNPHGRDSGRKADGAMVETTAVTHGIVVNICNFNKYQDPESYGGNDGGTADETTDGKRTAQKGKDINEEGKNKENKEKKIYIMPAMGEFENVRLTEEELEKLKEQFPHDWQDRIERLSGYIASKGKRYKSHYATILSWARKDKKDAEARNSNNKESYRTVEKDYSAAGSGFRT